MSVALVTAGEVDDVRVLDEEGFATALSALTSSGRRLATEYGRYTNLSREVAQARLATRSFMITQSGYPDWAGRSHAYRITVEAAEADLYDSLGQAAKRRLDAGVRAHIRRTYMLPAVIEWVLRHTLPEMEEELAVFEAAREIVLESPSRKLVNAVRKHYDSADLILPEGPFARTLTAVPPLPPSPVEVVAAFDEALDTLTSKQVVPDVGATELLKATTEVSQRVLAKGAAREMRDRHEIVAQLKRIARIAETTARIVNGEQDPARAARDEKRLYTLYWTEEDAPQL